MKLATLSRASLILALFLSAFLGAQAQSSVSVFLKPAADAYEVTSIPADDERLANASEMMQDPDTGLYWYWFELVDSFEGYVRKSYVTKGLTLKEGAPVYFEPGNEDAFITLADSSSQTEVVEVAGDWVKVQITTSLPVYFSSKQAYSESLPPVALSEPEAPANTTSTAPEEVPNYQIQDNTVVDTTPSEPTDLEGAIMDPTTGAPIDRILQGVIKPWKPVVPNPFSKPKYKWQLVNSRGKRLAFVDARNLVPNATLASYSGQAVSIKGTLYRVNRGKDILILANFITLQ